VNWLCEGSLAYLKAVYWPPAALFPYSSVVDSGAYVSDFRPVEARRYTINVLLGLKQAAEHAAEDRWLAGVDDMVDAFVERHDRHLASLADNGLLLVLLSADEKPHPHAAAVVRRLDSFVRETPLGRMTMQDLAWMLWGAVAAARHGLDGADELADRIIRLVTGPFLDPAKLLPRHSIQRYRRGLVSFGALVYCLRALAEYATYTGEDRAEELFRSGVEAALALQGPQGEWPWLIDLRTGKPADWYPIFAVHQDSMAILFLAPAAARGISGTSSTMRRSIGWILGDNELGERMVEDEPFCLYRSLERAELLPRMRRYARYAGARVLGHSASFPASSGSLRVNRECRPYHAGWILYVWAGAEQIPGLDTAPAPVRYLATAPSV
jgi:hypothetical protein